MKILRKLAGISVCVLTAFVSTINVATADSNTAFILTDKSQSYLDSIVRKDNVNSICAIDGGIVSIDNISGETEISIENDSDEFVFSFDFTKSFGEGVFGIKYNYDNEDTIFNELAIHTIEWESTVDWGFKNSGMTPSTGYGEIYADETTGHAIENWTYNDGDYTLKTFNYYASDFIKDKKYHFDIRCKDSVVEVFVNNEKYLIDSVENVESKIVFFVRLEDDSYTSGDKFSVDLENVILYSSAVDGDLANDYIIESNPEKPTLNVIGQLESTYSYGSLVVLPSATATDSMGQALVPKYRVYCNEKELDFNGKNLVVYDEGEYLVTIVATDRFGNKTAKTYSFTVSGTENGVERKASSNTDFAELIRSFFESIGIYIH